MSNEELDRGGRELRGGSDRGSLKVAWRKSRHLGSKHSIHPRKARVRTSKVV